MSTDEIAPLRDQHKLVYVALFIVLQALPHPAAIEFNTFITLIVK